MKTDLVVTVQRLQFITFNNDFMLYLQIIEEKMYAYIEVTAIDTIFIKSLVS